MIELELLDMGLDANVFEDTDIGMFVSKLDIRDTGLLVMKR